MTGAHFTIICCKVFVSVVFGSQQSWRLEVRTRVQQAQAKVLLEAADFSLHPVVVEGA